MADWPLLAGWRSASWRGSALFEYFFEKPYPRVPTWQAIRTPDWKFIHYSDLQDMDELYDLKADPHELKNRVKDEAVGGELKELKAELAKLLRETGGK